MPVRNLVKSMLVLLLFAAATPVFAQGQRQQKTPEERAQRQMTWMRRNLALTDGQDRKVYDILLHYAREADKAMDTPAGPDRKQERKDIQRNKDAEMQGELTVVQYQKYEAHMQEMKANAQQRRMGRPGGAN